MSEVEGSIVNGLRLQMFPSLFQIFVFIIHGMTCFGASYSNVDSCLESKHHKTIPGPESDSFKECTPWKNYSCCTSNVSSQLQTAEGFASLYNFHLNHCEEKQERLSDECLRHFVQDACFYQCEPNLGPWKQKVKRTFATERFFRVPLCFSDCESWFSACKYDYTCVTNWPMHMNFSGGFGNRCPSGAKCRTFEEVYSNASYFCNQVWDESFVAVPDNEPCMRIWFNGEIGNPNEHTAREYLTLQGIVNQATQEFPLPYNILLFSIVAFKRLLM